ncbi:hypothetical protein AXF42_Ash021008 [Apostasia shenzhenica]|uniref:Uncharacterized protein n=1 Tax=Apostasia shenzhenica TaxID=1088818 RepID=A0A2I0AEV2_9ASPA|nr:hypothetical protein AXF42_Ash021008 [Apostasia shenzhenica]
MDKLQAPPDAAKHYTGGDGGGSGGGGLVWDCNSALYDSFELRSFKQHLESAVAGRCPSMPRLSDSSPEPQPEVAQGRKKSQKAYRLSKSLQKLLRRMFRMKPPEAAVSFQLANRYGDDEQEVYGAYPAHWSGGGGLASIPEACEKGADSPDMESAVRRTVSERFTSSTGVPVSNPAA